MANQEDKNLNFEELKMPEEEAAAEEPVFEDETAPAEAADEAQLEPIERPEAAEAADDQVEETLEEVKEEKEGEPEEKAGNLTFVAEWAVAVGVPVVLAALFIVQIIHLSTAVYLFGMGFVCFALWKGRKSNTVTTVILGCALAALMTAAYCYWVVLREYGFDLKAQGAKQQVRLVRPNETADDVIA
ncbi:MAG: hypothetical protein JW959_10260 [Pirellulales bacterium]|nr:hypothetical protein [Pirellulales bacterium]